MLGLDRLLHLQLPSLAEAYNTVVLMLETEELPTIRHPCSRSEGEGERLTDFRAICNPRATWSVLRKSKAALDRLLRNFTSVYGDSNRKNASMRPGEARAAVVWATPALGRLSPSRPPALDKSGGSGPRWWGARPRGPGREASGTKK